MTKDSSCTDRAKRKGKDMKEKTWHEVFWEGFGAAVRKEPFDEKRSVAWQDGYKYHEKPTASAGRNWPFPMAKA